MFVSSILVKNFASTSTVYLFKLPPDLQFAFKKLRLDSKCPPQLVLFERNSENRIEFVVAGNFV